LRSEVLSQSAWQDRRAKSESSLRFAISIVAHLSFDTTDDYGDGGAAQRAPPIFIDDDLSNLRPTPLGESSEQVNLPADDLNGMF